MTLPCCQLYHISSHDIGDNPVLMARSPAMPGTGEHNMPPRVCFSTSLEGAIRGKSGGYGLFGAFRFFARANHFFDLCDGVLINPSVYVPTFPVATCPAFDALDFPLTGELFTTRSAPCRRIGYLSLSALMAGEVAICKDSCSVIDAASLMATLGYFDDREEADNALAPSLSLSVTFVST